MSLKGWTHLFVIISIVGIGGCVMAPFFKVTGMSSQLPDLCVVDYQDKVDINIEVTMAGCGTESEVIKTVQWRFYTLGPNNEYTIDTSQPYKNETETTLSISWDGLSEADMNIYAVEAIVSMEDFQDDFRIMGYLVVGCHSLADNSQKKCKQTKQDVNSLAGNMEQIWHLSSCNDTVATYKAKSVVDFSIAQKVGRPSFTEHDLYTAGIRLENKHSFMFKTKGESNAFILLQEDKDNLTQNIVEVEIGGWGNAKSVIRDSLNGIPIEQHLESDMLNEGEFRPFWISFAGEEVRVGKGEVPYAQQFLKWTSLQHGINFIAIGNGYDEGGDWKLDIDLCMQTPATVGTCAAMKWFYNKDSSTCQTTCDQISNCFQSEAACSKACGIVIGTKPFGGVCGDASECSTAAAVCIGSTCSCDSSSYYDGGSDSCLTGCCEKNCLQYKNPQSVVKYVVESDNVLFSNDNVSSYDWTVRECGGVDIETCRNGNTVETSSKSKLRFHRDQASAINIFGIFLEVLMQDGKLVNDSLVIQFSPEPEMGDCIVSPVSGYILLTHFTVTCTNFTVDGSFNITYKMKSSLLNEWKKGTKFYTGPNSTVAGVQLPQGDADNQYRLFIFVKASVTESGADVVYTSMIQVLPSYMAPDPSRVLEEAKALIEVTGSNQTSAIDDMIDAGNQEEAVQYLNIISSSLNTDNTTDADGTVTQEKIQVRTAVVTSLERVNVSSSETLFAVAQTLNEVTKVSTELSESTQDLAADLLDSLANNLESFDDDSANVSTVVDTAGEIFSGLTQLLDIRSDDGTKQLAFNESETTGNEQDSNKTEKFKNATGKLLNTVNKIGSTLLSNQVPGDPPVVMTTSTMSIQVEKITKAALANYSLSVEENVSNVTSLKFPSVIGSLDGALTDLGVQMLHMKKNPYVWDRTATGVNMEVMSVDLRNSNNSEVTVANLSQPVKITLECPEAEVTESKLLLHIKKDNGNFTYDLSRSNMLITNFTAQEGKTTVLSIYSGTEIKTLKIHISDSRKPIFDEVKDVGVTYPDHVSSLTKNFSRFDLSNETAENSSLIYITYNNSMDVNYTGIYFVAVTLDLESNATLEYLRGLDSDCLRNESITDCDAVLEIPLKLETISLACTYWDKSAQAWSGKGCEVTPFSTKEKLECLCTHLTAFSGGVFVLPNFVDPIGDAALFLTFFENPVVVTTVVVVWILYFFLIHWARQADRKDQERVGVLAVGDVDTTNKYLYLVCVVTGWWTDAGTTANVFFYMEGSKGSSKRIKLTTSARLCFQTGYEDWFLVSTEKTLGELQNVTLWHDNTGTSPHWYLSQLFVKDLQKHKSWTFIYNDWLAVDRGTVVRTTASLSAVTKEQLKLNQKHNFMVKTTQDLRDSHLWISIFSKPVRSTFTRVQRVTCALSLLLTTMLTNIMFYGIPTDDPDDQVGGARGIVISLSSIVIGIQSSLIMFPVNVIIMQMFLKLKQKPVKEEMNLENQSYIQSLFNKVSNITTDALQDLAASVPFSVGKEYESLQTNSSSTFEDKPDNGRQNGSVVQSSSSSSFVTASPYSSVCNDPGHSIQVTYSGSSMSKSLDEETSDQVGVAPSKSGSSGIVVLSESKQTGKILPWWFLYIAWTLVLTVSAVCSYFVMLYGLKYGYQRSVEWLVSFLTGFSQSALVTQPLKVLAVAVIITLIFKRAVEFEDYGPEVRLDEDAAFVESVNKAEEIHIPYSQPLSSSLLKQIRQRLQLEWLMDVTIRDICLYIFYLVIVCIVVHGHRDIKEAYYNSVAIEDVLVNPGCINLNLCFFLAKVDNVKTFYQYLYDSAIPNLADMSVADHEYATPGSSHFLVGPWRLRQLRIETGTCGEGADKLFSQFNMNVPQCSGPYWLGDEEKGHFNNSWGQPLSEATDPPNMWTYQSAWKLKTIPFAGKLATYSGGGYIITMPKNHTLHEGIVQEMWNTDWIDQRTRAVFLEFSLYNPNADLFSVVIILFEFSNNGAVFPYHQIFSTRLNHYSTDFAIFVAVCEALFLIFNIAFAYNEWKKISVLGKKKYFEDYWSYIELIQIILSFCVVGLFFQRLVSVSSVMKDFRDSDGKSFISFYTAISWDFILGYVMAFLVALVTLKAIKLLKFNKRTYMVADTVAYSKSSIFSFLVLAVLVAIAFGHFATMAFGKVIEDYRDMLRSLITLFNFSMGVSDLQSLQETNRILGPVYFVSFVFVVTFVFLTVFVAILNFGISDSKAMFEKRQNKFELLEYVTKKLKNIVNIEQ